MSIGHVNVEQATNAMSDAPLSAPEDMAECLACSTKYPKSKLIKLPCEDKYCQVCLLRLFKAAMKDETMYPPRCCRKTIRIELAQKHLPQALIRQFKAKGLEMETRNRTYCSRSACSAFIKPQSIHNGQAICQRCRAVTCSKCKTAWHFGPCKEEDDTGFFDFVRSTDWKRCPECRRVVEKSEGCNHMA